MSHDRSLFSLYTEGIKWFVPTQMKAQIPLDTQEATKGALTTE